MTLTACWAAKGGAGTSVIAAALGLLTAHMAPSGALLADLDGDLPDVVGIPEPSTPGLAEYLRDRPAGLLRALGRIELDAAPGLRLIPRGTGPFPAERAAVLAALSECSPRPVIVDCGTLRPGTAASLPVDVARTAQRSLLVITPCYLSLRRALHAPVQATGAVVVARSGRPLNARHIEDSLHVPVVATVPDDTSIGLAVDSGLISRKLPRLLARGLRGLAQTLVESP